MEELKMRNLSSGKSPVKSPKRPPPPPLSARVKVAVRVRPPVASNGNEIPQLCVSESEPETGANADNAIQFQLDKTQKSFKFDHIFSTEASQADVYIAALHPLLMSLLHGFNVTVLAYGQTGSGKTYTMGGAETSAVECGNDDGLILRFLRDFFAALRKEASIKTTIKISFLEIYCDEIRDLLVERARSNSQNGGRQNSGKLTIHEDDYDVWIEGLQQINVKSVNEALNLLKAGRQRQTVGAHALNDQSSRSHAVYTLEVSRTFNNEIKHSKLTFVDLAGSERVKKTLLEGHGMKEGSHINIGLLALGNVINALGSRNRPLQRLNSPANSRGSGSGNSTPRHIPYRSSKLTRLLRDALGGNSVTLFIACVSPELTNGNETLNTLQYANRARSIQNKALKNVEEAVAEDIIIDAASGTENERLIYALQEQVAALKLQLDHALAAAKAAESYDSSLANFSQLDHTSSPPNPENGEIPKLCNPSICKRRLQIVPLELDLPAYTDVRDTSCSFQRRQKECFFINSSIVKNKCTNHVTSGEQQSLVPAELELVTHTKASIEHNEDLRDYNENSAAPLLSEPQLITDDVDSIQSENVVSRRVMIDQGTQYEPLRRQHVRKTPIDYVLLSPSEIFREVHNQKVLEGAPSPWPHRRRLDVQHNDSRHCSAKFPADNNNDTANSKNLSCSKPRDVLHDLLRYTRQIVENSPDFVDLDSTPEVNDPDKKEGQSPLSFDTFVDRMTALYDQRSRQHQFVQRLRQRFRHLASLLDVADIDNQMTELSKYTLQYQQDSLQQLLTTFEHLAAERLWMRLQNREVAIENYARVWNDILAEVFLSEDQYEACRPWHSQREDHDFFQHRILPFVLNGWISVTPRELENEQLWLAL
ncbi:hypothetical protein L914_06764 [Phytophthora nicotianae]|uniref:Kinesin-like protein n=2 Tax=Phytophthora nicotianae TaxID=4792 RepID=V9FC93_PHYNI|nr:hypothetical protein F443_06977 [Phytophthora nicotianae P1569]ETM48751.1 hypothetical protein L914_06764 [Phytophthora nicotianae]